MNKAKSDYYTGLIEDNSTNQKRLYSIMTKLLGRGAIDQPLPSHADVKTIANDFGRFFVKKISYIRAKLDQCATPTNTQDARPAPQAAQLLSKFVEVSIDDIKELVRNSCNKSCDTDLHCKILH